MITSLGTGRQADSSTIRKNTAGTPWSPIRFVTQSTRRFSTRAGRRRAARLAAVARRRCGRRGTGSVDLDALRRGAGALLEAIALRRGHEEQVAAAIVVAHVQKPSWTPFEQGAADAPRGILRRCDSVSSFSSAPSWPRLSP